MPVLLIIMTFAADEPAPPVFFAGNEELRGYLLEAAEKNPGLKARYAEWQAALRKIPQVTSLEDPMFMYSQFVQSSDKRFAVSLEQKFPWFGTLRARGDKALAEADAALARFCSARNELFAQVKQAYFEYALLGASIRIAQSQVDLLGEVEEIVRSRYALGLGAESDLFRAQIEKEKAQDRVNGFHQSGPALAAKLNETLGRENREEPPWPQPAEFPPPPPPASVVLEQIRAANPNLSAMQRMVETWQKEGAIAKKMGYPEFSVGLEYGDMKDMARGSGSMSGGGSADVEPDVMLTLKFSLPIWRKRIQGGVQEAKLMEEAAEHDKRRALLALDSAARMTLFNIEDGLRRYRLYKDTLIPKEKQTYESLQASYGAGDYMTAGSTFIDILDSVRMLLEFQLEQARAARDVQAASAELEMLMGGPWASETALRQSNAPATVESKPSAPSERTP